MAASYGFDVSRPAANAREAVQWVYFGYLGAVKEQDGAAMSMVRARRGHGAGGHGPRLHTPWTAACTTTSPVPSNPASLPSLALPPLTPPTPPGPHRRLPGHLL
jgi:hypothetical protein